MIPLNEAIEAGIWLRADAEDRYGFSGFEIISFQMRPLSLEKIDLTAVDNPEFMEIEVTSNAWVLKADVVNLCLKTMNSQYVENCIRLFDNEGYSFTSHWETHLGNNSRFAKAAGFNRWFCAKLQPKVRVLASIIYLLPDSFDNLLIGVEGGTIKEA